MSVLATVSVRITVEKLNQLRMLADWQLREQGFVPVSVNAACREFDDVKKALADDPGENTSFLEDEGDPDQVWTVWTREKKSDPLTRRDSYEDQEVAVEFASEFFHQYRHYEAVVLNALGEKCKQFQRMSGAGGVPRKSNRLSKAK